ncbi:MAG: TM0106 family RecB-like putative nuclease, partial [Bacteroidetes bacterium]
MKLINHSLRYSASDLINYLGCRHLTELDRKSAMGEIGQPGWVNPSLALIQQKGLEHERAYVGHLKSLGLKVRELDGQFSPVTTGLLREGYDVITQARFERDGWVGIADILRKVPGKSSLGDFFYEVEDTKLARETKAGTVIQLCLYSEMLGELQDRIPDYMSVVKPGSGFITERFRYQEFDAYYRTIKRRFMEWMAAGPHKTSPLPVPKCDTCRWWMECNRKWHAEDHLSLVAGIRTGQIRELETQGIPTLETYALEEKPFRSRPGQGSEETYHKIHRQARVQLDGRVAGKMLYDLLPFEPLRGLNRLPEPSPGDIYFDIEGDHFYEDGGIEYLFGACYREAGRGMVYRSFWAKDRQEEKKAFGSFVRFVMDRWNEYPGMHIYHYAPYEPSAVKRLASRHAIHEQEVDRLLRSMRFVDLYSVIRETMMASVESYSLKDVER